MRRSILKPVAPAIILFLASTGPALAYLDPGTASIILQGLIGGGVAAASFIAIYWRKFVSLFSRKKPQPAEPEKKTEPN
jgi:hypothetical protein